MDVPAWVWWLTIGSPSRSSSSTSSSSAAARTSRPTRGHRRAGIYIGMAMLFGIGVWVIAGHQYGTEFFAGWLTEYSLSVDNLFIFIIIMSRFGVPRQYQQEALLIGIVLALVFRGIFIALGAAAIEQFSWVFYVFGAFLVYTGFKLAKQGPEDEDEYEENRLVTWVRTVLPHTEDYRGGKLWCARTASCSSRRCSRSIVALGTTDLLFALDSIPAIFGLTRSPTSCSPRTSSR